MDHQLAAMLVVVKAMLDTLIQNQEAFNQKLKRGAPLIPTVSEVIEESDRIFLLKSHS